VDALLARLSAREFNEWAAFYEKDPWGDQRADVRAGIIASTLANIHRDKHAKAFLPQDFMWFAERPDVHIDESEIERKIETFMAVYTRH
jgi:hypothetical protein